MEITWRNVWFESKAWLETQVGMQSDAMHTHFGLLVFLAFAVLLRHRRYGLLLGWVIVATIQIINEALDARDWINWTGTVNWSETVKDTVATLFWPTLLLVILPWIRPKSATS
ncbi:MAG: hypothetical protein AAF674_22650 [Pseudomonadota bacterium]